METLNVFTDGSSKGNPGPASIGIIFFINNIEIFRQYKSIGIATNNDAEYQAVIYALEKIKQIRNQYNFSRVIFFCDSELMVNQLNGLYKIKSGKIKEYLLKIKILEQEIRLPIVYKKIPRNQNKVADEIARG